MPPSTKSKRRGSSIPRTKGRFYVAAGLALRNMDIARADALLNQGLGYNPGNLELLSMKAAMRFLADDRDGLREAKTGSIREEPRVHALLSDRRRVRRVGASLRRKSSR